MSSSEPQFMTGIMPSLEISRVTLVEAQTRASSSTMMAWVTWSAPAPPYSIGIPRAGSSMLHAGLEAVPGERWPPGRPRPRGGRCGPRANWRRALAELPLGVGQGECRGVHCRSKLSPADRLAGWLSPQAQAGVETSSCHRPKSGRPPAPGRAVSKRLLGATHVDDGRRWPRSGGRAAGTEGHARPPGRPAASPRNPNRTRASSTSGPPAPARTERHGHWPRSAAHHARPRPVTPEGAEAGRRRVVGHQEGVALVGTGDARSRRPGAGRCQELGRRVCASQPASAAGRRGGPGRPRRWAQSWVGSSAPGRRWCVVPPRRRIGATARSRP